MTRKTNKPVPKGNRFTVMTSEEATRAAMPKYNPFQTGHGTHGTCGYNRRDAKCELRRELEQY